MEVRTRTHIEPPTAEELERRNKAFERILELRKSLHVDFDVTELIREGRDELDERG